MTDEIRYMRGKEAGAYLKNKYGFGSEKSLAKLRSVGGGPLFRRALGDVVVYAVRDLDEWAESKIGAALRSTSDDSSEAA